MFKFGDKVRILDNTDGDIFNEGDVGYVLENDGGDWYPLAVVANKSFLNRTVEELEDLEEAFDIVLYEVFDEKDLELVDESPKIVLNSNSWSNITISLSDVKIEVKK